MDIRTNRFKRAIAEGRLQIGLWSQLITPVATEVIAEAGFDFVVVDAEHAPNDVVTVVPQLQILDRSEASIWNNPLTAGAIVLGAAILVGVLVKDLTDDELQASQN